jgi:hypothetical protein
MCAYLNRSRAGAAQEHAAAGVLHGRGTERLEQVAPKKQLAPICSIETAPAVSVVWTLVNMLPIGQYCRESDAGSEGEHGGKGGKASGSPGR